MFHVEQSDLGGVLLSFTCKGVVMASQVVKRWAKSEDVTRFLVAVEFEYKVDISVEYLARENHARGSRAVIRLLATTLPESLVPPGTYEVYGEVIQRDKGKTVDPQVLLYISRLMRELSLAMMYGETAAEGFSPFPTEGIDTRYEETVIDPSPGGS